MVNEEREQEQRGGLLLLLSEASTFRSALHVVKYGCGQFSTDRTHCKRNARRDGEDGGRVGRGGREVVLQQLLCA